MFLDIILVAVGLLLIVYGAEFLTKGSASLAREFNIPEIIIGLTIVSIGTSAPEFVVSVLSSIEGKGDVAIGNVVGSNIFNTFVILGITSIIAAIKIRRSNVKIEIPFVVFATLMLCILSLDKLLSGSSQSIITRIDGIILVSIFIIFISYTITTTIKHRSKQETMNRVVLEKKYPIWNILLMIILGLAALLFGGNLFMNNAVSLATKFGISNHIIAITLMAGGTSLPELAASISAARKGSTQMAIGNVIGSNIFNSLFVVGVAAIINPLSLGNITAIDMGVLMLSSLMLFASIFYLGKLKIFYQDGIVFLLVYIGYMIWLFL